MKGDRSWVQEMCRERGTNVGEVWSDRERHKEMQGEMCRKREMWRCADREVQRDVQRER